MFSIDLFKEKEFRVWKWEGKMSSVSGWSGEEAETLGPAIGSYHEERSLRVLRRGGGWHARGDGGPAAVRTRGDERAVTAPPTMSVPPSSFLCIALLSIVTAQGRHRHLHYPTTTLAGDKFKKKKIFLVLVLWN